MTGRNYRCSERDDLDTFVGDADFLQEKEARLNDATHSPLLA